MAVAGGSYGIISTQTFRRLDEQYAIAATDPVAPVFRQLMLTLELRFQALERFKVDWETALKDLVDHGLTRINEVLGPATEKLLAYTELGWLLVRSQTELTIDHNTQALFIVDEGPARDLFIPTPFLAIQRQTSPDTFAIAHLEQFHRPSGSLLVTVLVYYGNPGPHSDWVITAAPGVSEATRYYFETVMAAGISTAADAAQVATDREYIRQAREALEQAGLNPDIYAWRDGSRSFTAIQHGVAPSSGANDTALVTAAWARARANDAITGLQTGAPTTMNTFARLALALGNDPNFSTNLDNRFVPRIGGTMTGLLTLSGNGTANLHAATVGQMNSAIATAVAGVTAGAGTYLPIGGGTLTGTLTSRAIVMQGYNLTGAGGISTNAGGNITATGATVTGQQITSTGNINASANIGAGGIISATSHIYGNIGVFSGGVHAGSNGIAYTGWNSTWVSWAWASGYLHCSVNGTQIGLMATTDFVATADYNDRVWALNSFSQLGHGHAGFQAVSPNTGYWMAAHNGQWSYQPNFWTLSSSNWITAGSDISAQTGTFHNSINVAWHISAHNGTVYGPWGRFPNHVQTNNLLGEGGTKFEMGGTDTRYFKANGQHFISFQGGNNSFSNHLGPIYWISDMRRKRNIRQDRRGLNVICNLHPIEYERVGVEAAYDELGFSAQELQQVIPEAVMEQTVDGEPLLHMTDTPIIAACVNAINELRARLEALEAKL